MIWRKIFKIMRILTRTEKTRSYLHFGPVRLKTYVAIFFDIEKNLIIFVFFKALSISNDNF